MTLPNIQIPRSEFYDRRDGEHVCLVCGRVILDANLRRSKRVLVSRQIYGAASGDAVLGWTLVDPTEPPSSSTLVWIGPKCWNNHKDSLGPYEIKQRLVEK